MTGHTGYILQSRIYIVKKASLGSLELSASVAVLVYHLVPNNPDLTRRVGQQKLISYILSQNLYNCGAVSIVISVSTALQAAHRLLVHKLFPFEASAVEAAAISKIIRRNFIFFYFLTFSYFSYSKVSKKYISLLY